MSCKTKICCTLLGDKGKNQGSRKTLICISISVNPVQMCCSWIGSILQWLINSNKTVSDPSHQLIDTYCTMYEFWEKVFISQLYQSVSYQCMKEMFSLFCLLYRMCGYYSPSEPLTFLSSGNVMLVTMATNEWKNYPGFRAQISQVRRGSKGRKYRLSEPLCLMLHHKCWMFMQMLILFSNRYNMRWPADRR